MSLDQRQLPEDGKRLLFAVGGLDDAVDRQGDGSKEKADLKEREYAGEEEIQNRNFREKRVDQRGDEIKKNGCENRDYPKDKYQQTLIRMKARKSGIRGRHQRDDETDVRKNG